MIKQAETDKKLEFGVDYTTTKKKRVQKEKPVTPPTPKKLCAFQETIVVERLGKSVPCQSEALENGWCQEHQRAQAGMDEGARLGWRGVEVPMCAVYYEGSLHQFTLIIGPGRRDWLAYFEKATGTGLETVMKYLQTLA